MNKFYVYFHIRPDNMEIFYVGKGMGRRAWGMKGRNNYHNNIQEKVRREHREIVVIVIDHFDSEKEAFELEKRLIAILRPPANYTNGGEGTNGLKWTEESRRKLSATVTGKKLSEEHRKKLSISHKDQKMTEKQLAYIRENYKGEGNPFFGKRHSEETRQRMSEAAKKRRASDETRRKMSEAHRGRKKTPQHIHNATIGRMKAAIARKKEK